MPDRKTKKALRNAAGKSGRSSSTTGSYLLSLELENVRCFSERQTLDLSDGNGGPARWTILLGENGTGKTTILQLLAIFHWANSAAPGRAPVATSVEMASNVIRAYLLNQTLIRNPDGPWPKIVVKAAYELGSLDDSIMWRAESFIKYTSKNEFEFLATKDDQALPICYAYGAGRRLGPPSLNRDGSGDPSESFFLDDENLLGSEEWLLRLDYSASKRSGIQARQKQRLDMVKEVLIKILPGVSEIRFDPSSGVVPTPRVEFRTPYGWVPLKQLGYGYRTMIAWVVDFAARMVERYPDSLDPLAEPAVVLVDEIDLHLHPKWQREVIGYLTERFPNTQFIVTAHSPLIVQAAAGANIAVLRREGDHVVIENHPETIRGWRVDQVLTSDLFGLETARPPDVEKLLIRRKDILTKPRLTKADQRELDEINDQIGPIAPGESFEEARKTMDLIERSIELVKKYQGTKA